MLGYVESDVRGPIEVWYSAEREVLRLQNGRLVGASGAAIEWRRVDLPFIPAWSDLARTAQPLRFVRTRDVMPGYRVGLRDALTLRPVGPPSRSALAGLDAAAVLWFEERFEAPSRGLAASQDDAVLPPARYAVRLDAGGEIVVYGEQCLSVKLCFTWQRWPVAPENRK